jgi:hypothetical protein
MPKQAIEEFRELYRQYYGIELTDGEAETRARNFLYLYIAVLGSDRDDPLISTPR